MATVYSFKCETCKNNGTVLEPDEEPGVAVLILPMSERDYEYKCSEGHLMQRVSFAEKFTVLWGNKYNNKKTSLGPTVNHYPPSLERAKRERTRHIDMSSSGNSSSHRDAKEEGSRMPTSADLPPPGISVPKG